MQTRDPIASRLEQACRQDVFPGASLLIGVGGEITYARVVGLARREPSAERLGVGTWFDLASVTKAIGTSVAVMLAVDSGRGDLSEPLGERLPLPSPLSTLTPWHLLAHTSGLPDWRPLYQELDAARQADAGLENRAAARRFLRAQVAATPLEYTPGTRAVYSDLGFMLLEWWLEQVFGARLDRILAERFFGPLGCREIGFVDLDQPPPPPPGGYAATERCAWRGRVVQGEVHDQNSWAMGGVSGQAGLFGTAREVHRVLTALWQAFRGESPLLGAATVRRFWSPSGVPGSVFRLGWDGPSETGYSAAGARMSRQAVGHLGFTGGSVWLEPEAGRWVVLLTNRVHPSVENPRLRPFRPLIHDLVLGEVLR